MWVPGWIASVLPAKSRSPATASAGALRDRIAVLLAIMTFVGLGAAFLLSKGTQSLMPGPLASAHGAIEKCGACHTKSGSGKLSWLHGLVAGDPLADSKACLTCHKMPDTAFNPHGASAEALKDSTQRLTKIAAETPAPRSARAQNAVFPTDGVLARDLYCATCHQEHQGVNFSLDKITNEQCRSCHVVKFGSFDGHHPKFENYPFKRRTRIIYDHAGHFGKHFPEVAKKDPAKRIPDTCSNCHNSKEDKRVMAVAPFDQTCTTCHLNQITGKERASGPKGIAFLSLPGLDLDTLKKKNAAIGEWPDASEAALTPFMKVMISRDERGRALLKTVDNLNLQDLTNASDDQIKAVTNLVWEIKGLFFALISGKASDVLADLNISSGAKLSAALVTDLTASIPRDVVVSAHQQWLPNLATEMATRPVRQKQSSLGTVITQSSMAVLAATLSDGRQGAPNVQPDSGMQFFAADESDGATTGGRVPLPSGTPRAIDARKDAEKAVPPKGATEETEGAKDKPDGGIKAPSAAEQPSAEKSVKPNSGSEVGGAPQDNATGQTDDLLFPTEDELRGVKSGSQDAGKSVQPAEAVEKPDGAKTKADSAAPAASPDANAPAGAPAASGSGAAAPQKAAAPVITIESDIDPESWAEYGGWYREDFTIYYRPTGHKDKFVYSWLFLTGPQAPKGDTGPAAAVFDFLTGKEAQGSCTKCHSVDDIQSKGRVVNFSPPSVESKQGSFTKFVHEPHFSIMENRGCLTCHTLERDRPYLKSYEQGNPKSFASNFAAVKKDLCKTCHNTGMARQDCLLCHEYHVNGVITPIMQTKLPTQ